MIYQYHSIKFGSPVQVTYNKHGILTGFTVMNNEQVEKIHSHKDVFENYFREVDFLASAKQHGLKLTQIERTITFDMFWDAYQEKNCGRKKAEAVWTKLSKADQLGAYDYIPAFNGILKMNGTAKPYATSYLNQTRWIK